MIDTNGLVRKNMCSTPAEFYVLNQIAEWASSLSMTIATKSHASMDVV
jgi:hypothetical protein